MVTFYIYKIIFLCGFPCGRYYIGKHMHRGKLENDNYAGSGKFCKAYFKKYGKLLGQTYVKEILEINPSDEINTLREKEIIGDLYKTDQLCMNLIEGGGKSPNNTSRDHQMDIVQYDLFGNIITTYKTQLEAAADNGFIDSSGISKCCLNKTDACGRYIWRYKKDGPPNLESLKIHSVPVIQYTKDGQMVQQYKDILTASKETGIEDSSIAHCCNRKRFSAGGFIWRRFNDPLLQCEMKTDKYWGKRKVMKLDIDGNILQEFLSIREAAKYEKVIPQAIQRVCAGKRKTLHGFVWKYVENF